MTRGFCIDLALETFSYITELAGRKENLQEPQTDKHMRKKTHTKLRYKIGAMGKHL